MWKTPFQLALAALLLCAALPVQAAESGVNEDAKEWVVVLTDPRPARRRGWAAGVGYGGSYRYENDPRLERLADELAADHAIEITDQWPVRTLNVHCLVVRLTDEAEATLAALREDERVEWVQPFNTFEALGTLRAAPGDDPYRHLQTSLESMNVSPVHRHLSGAGVRVAVIDSAVEADHPDLEHALADSMDFVGDDDGNASERHGTGIAGVLVAASGNGVGISGVAPGVRLHAYRACWESDDGTRCNSITLSRALDQVATLEPHILNLSLTGPEDRLLDRLLDRILATGTIVVVAWDERTRNGGRFPTPRAGIVMVRNGSGVSAEGADALYAPGEAVLTSQPGHSYDFMTGSSLAAAHVSGVLALMLEANPDAPLRESARALAGSQRPVANSTSIDACEAIRHAKGDVRCAESDR